MAIKTNASAAMAYAPLDSPIFIGAPTAPTPATMDATTKLATTAHVDARVSVMAEIATELSANFDIGLTHIGRVVPVAPGAVGTTVTATIRLATIIAYPTDAALVIYRRGVGTVVVAAEAGVSLAREGTVGADNGSGIAGPFTVRAVAGEIHLRRRGSTNTWIASGAIA